MKSLLIAAMVAVLAWPVYARAQMPNINLLADQPSKTPEEIEKEQAQEKAYKESLKKIPDAKTTADPWGGVRSSDAAKSTSSSKTTTPTKKTKTGSNAN
jgi:hypothetical protein